MREQIIELARLNTEIGSADAKDMHLLKLNSIEDLDDVKDLMCEDAIDSLEDEENRTYISEDISGGVTFIFWNNEDGELEYSR